MNESTQLHNPLTKHLALLTDFGTSDHYVATVKAVILSLNPSLQIIDVTHSVKPGNISEAGFLLWASYRFFPKDTLFLCIVDPGVGTSRPIAFLSTESYSFLAPDNGALEYVHSSEPSAKFFHLNLDKCSPYLPQMVSSTFHGRDIFAPIAAHISLGLPLSKVADEIQRTPPRSPFVSSKESEAASKILHIDHFGSLITNIAMENSKEGEHKIMAITIGQHRVSQWVQTYGQAPENVPVLLVGSTGLVEIAMKNASAANALHIDENAKIRIEWK
ncbi:MAG TPA: SAM-dependent chlorinase/fluorinase [Bacteroidota bacterium]|nr:SAM-dependent chlorinase/fluorinase [Bacteroidota bacterium]